MKKKNLIPIFSLILSACTYPNLIPSAPGNSQPIVPIATTPVLSLTPTIEDTPTPPSATFTETPTLIYLYASPTMTVEDTPTETPGSIITLTPNITETPPLQTIPKDSLFTTITVSGASVFWGVCEPSSVKLTTHISNLANIYTVTVWLRLANKTTGDTTEWGGGAIMDDKGQGNFTYNLTAKSFSHYREYLNAWGQYQLVASDINLHRIGASAQYLNNITVAPCP